MEKSIKGDIKADGTKLMINDNGERLIKTIMNITTESYDAN